LPLAEPDDRLLLPDRGLESHLVACSAEPGTIDLWQNNPRPDEVVLFGIHQGDAVDTQIAVAMIASLTSLAVAVGGIPLSYLIAKRQRREQDLDLMSHYRDPLLQAAADLRSRLRAILVEDFLERFLINGKDTQKVYAIRHTLFVFAEFLCWMEILRQGVSFLDLGDDARNRKLMRHITIIRRVMFDNQMDPLFWVVMGYQRALGELMMRPDDPSRARARQCIGYAEFSSRLETDSTFARWFDGLAADIPELAKRKVVRTDRLVALEGAVVDLIDFLDPNNVRYPLRRSRRVSDMSSEEVAAAGTQSWGKDMI
jgi:hypothetical protein